ncbi:STAS domain-containing protein [Streptomyces sp. ISL-99]|uniref:STAS domain-containing protein n=1 Tax=Streptomyces sp. ISL-99 TaxID=2819193 RepID=UPI0027E4E2EA|nr:STAS domain-containing protein [Streptomyces sp. ISL-99]
MHTRSTEHHMLLVTHRLGHAVVLAPQGEVDLESVGPLRLALDAEARHGEGPVVLDLSAVRFADTALVNALLRVRPELGDRLRMVAPSALVTRLLRVLCLESAFTIRDSWGAAVDRP